MTFNILAALAGAASAFVIGGVWYSPLLFGKTWQRLNDISDEELGKNMARTFIGAAILSLIIAFNLAAFLGPKVELTMALAASSAAGIGWVATSMGITYLFERRPLKLYLINAGYHVVIYVLMGLILGLWH